MNEKSIGKKLVKAIGNDDLKDIVIDAAELGLDSITDSQIIDDIPIIGTAYKLFKTGVTIRDRFLLKNILAFLLNLRDINEEKRKKFIDKHYNNEDETDNIGEKLLTTLDKLNDINQIELLSIFFRKYIEEEIDLDLFYDLYYTTQSIHHHKLKYIILLGSKTHYRFKSEKEYLKDLNIIDSSNRLTRIGKLFFDSITNSEKLFRRYFFQLIISMDSYYNKSMNEMAENKTPIELTHLKLRKYIMNSELEFLKGGYFYGARYEYKKGKITIFKAETNYFVFGDE